MRICGYSCAGKSSSDQPQASRWHVQKTIRSRSAVLTMVITGTHRRRSIHDHAAHDPLLHITCTAHVDPSDRFTIEPTSMLTDQREWICIRWNDSLPKPLGIEEIGGQRLRKEIDSIGVGDLFDRPGTDQEMQHKCSRPSHCIRGKPLAMNSVQPQHRQRYQRKDHSCFVGEHAHKKCKCGPHDPQPVGQCDQSDKNPKGR